MTIDKNAPVTVLGTYCMHETHPSYEPFEAAFLALPGARQIEVLDPRSDREIYVVAEMTRGELATLIAAHPAFAATLAPDCADDMNATYGFLVIDADLRVTMHDADCEMAVDMDAFERGLLLHAVYPDRFEKPVPPAAPVPQTLYEHMLAETRALVDRKAA